MRKEPKALNFDEFAEELLSEKQPRALVILVSAKIDVQLRLLIEAHLLPKFTKANEDDELLDGTNPLSTFSSRIKICRRLGLIDGSLAGAIDKLREIRNLAAHWISFGIADSPRSLLRHLRSIVETRRAYKLTVERFFNSGELDEFESLQAALLTLCVLVESINVNATEKVLTKKTKKT